MPRTPVPGPPDPDGADCVACGCCCFQPAPAVSLHTDSEDRLSAEQLERFTEVQRRPPFMRFLKLVDAHCAALDVSVADRYPCTIYEVRPTGCRAFAPGSRACLEARARGELGDCSE